MNKNWIWLAFGVLLIMACNIQTPAVSVNFDNVRGSGKVISEDRQVSDFQRIILQGSGELIIEQGSREALTIEAEDNLLPVLTSEVQNGTLTLSSKRGMSIQPTKPIRYHLQVKDLSGLEISGSGKAQMEKLEGDSLHLRISGSGDVTIQEIDVNELGVTISGSGEVQAAGTADKLSVNVSGSGTCRLEDLQSQQAEVTISGGGDITVWVEEQLDVRVSGSGNVSYYGKPQTNTRISGSGELKDLGER